MTSAILNTEKPFSGRSLVGQTFHRLTVISYAGKDAGNNSYWDCRCSCGNPAVVLGRQLTRGRKKTCGCIKVERGATMAGLYLETHGESHSVEYHAFKGMHGRCYNPNNHKYSDYGGRGIAVCESWHTFENWFADMGRKPSPSHSLGRIDNNGNYEPGNCEWQTPKQQSRNTRRNHVLEFNGTSASLIRWQELTGIRHETIRKRLDYGWTVTQALTTPLRGTPCH